ncbi:N-acetyltransferase family protein [Geitlerinema sp. P-1104]|uniref:GNAT family N-acetyltransferase n=1 Tax=Geitlerinema sp. P-1104 TaxID=2546230 RepID=UPI0014776E58|nr:GNAT family N-acetyltransferase [Geitlerinema sp. P-1104]NMG56940.1 N-acetyltransferase family protein [Geitlerinema sp. P-1104]
MNVRHAHWNDLSAIVGIYNAAIPGRIATADLAPVSVESRRPWFAGHSPHQYPLWVTERDQQVVGWLSFRPFYGRPAYEATAELAIYIAPDYQGQGLGRFLLDLAVANAPLLELKTLLAFVFAHNLASLGLFERAKFQEWGYLPRIAELDGVERDLIILGHRLVQGDRP